MDAHRSKSHPGAVIAVMAATLAVSACGQAPTRPVPTAPPAPPPPQVFVYPAGGQDPARLDRDRYDCHVWAVRQSRFDPSMPGTPAAQRAQVVRVGPPPGAAVAAGALSGAVLGAAVASPRNTGEGALIGAAAGALVGAVAEGAAADEARRVQVAHDSAASAQESGRADGYRRAITACLEARGYTVR